MEHIAHCNTEGLLTFKFAPTDDSMKNSKPSGASAKAVNSTDTALGGLRPGIL